MHYKVWDEINYSFLNFNGATFSKRYPSNVEVSMSWGHHGILIHDKIGRMSFPVVVKLIITLQLQENTSVIQWNRYNQVTQ